MVNHLGLEDPAEELHLQMSSRTVQLHLTPTFLQEWMAILEGSLQILGPITALLVQPVPSATVEQEAEAQEAAGTLL